MPVSHVRRTVLWSSTTLAAGGWLGSLACYLHHGQAAGIEPGFIAALTIGAAFTIVAAMTAVMPDQQRIYALGFRDGQGAASGDKRPRHLSAVR